MVFSAARARFIAYRLRMKQDVLADVLQTLRVGRAQYGSFQSDRPWAIHVRPSDTVRFYALLGGSCHLELEGETGITLTRGDLVVLPHGTRHTLKGDEQAPLACHESVLEHTWSPRNAHGGPPTAASDRRELIRLVSGRFTFEEPYHRHWWTLLPSVITMQNRSHTLPWLESTLRFIESESDARRPGAQTVVSRLTDLLVLQVIREHLTSLQAEGTASSGWLAALVEPQIGTALALLHERPAQAWTVQNLARQVGMSRSAFAARFTRLVGEPPLHYLTRVRMAKAAVLLRDTRSATAEIADRVGYVSDTAFCKAFKRSFGQSPGAYRRMVRVAPSQRAA